MQGYRAARPESVHRPGGCGFGFWGAKSDARYNCGQGPHCPSHSLSPFYPNIVPTPESHRSVASSAQASYPSPRRKRQVSLIPLRLLSPQNLRFCGDPIFRRGVLTWSYAVRTVIQLSFEVVPLLSSLGTFFAIHNPVLWLLRFEKPQVNRKSRFTQHLAERIEIPFRSKKLCKSALLQSRSLFVRRPVNRLKTGG